MSLSSMGLVLVFVVRRSGTDQPEGVVCETVLYRGKWVVTALQQHYNRHEHIKQSGDGQNRQVLMNVYGSVLSIPGPLHVRVAIGRVPQMNEFSLQRRALAHLLVVWRGRGLASHGDRFPTNEDSSRRPPLPVVHRRRRAFHHRTSIMLTVRAGRSFGPEPLSARHQSHRDLESTWRPRACFSVGDLGVWTRVPARRRDVVRKRNLGDGYDWLFLLTRTNHIPHDSAAAR